MDYTHMTEFVEGFMDGLTENAGDVMGALLGGLVIVSLITIALCVFMIVCDWKVMRKMGMPGWYCLIPFFGPYMETKAVYGIGWWFLIPLASTIAGWIGITGVLLSIINIVVLVYGIKYAIDFTLCFGKPWYFAILVYLLPIVAIPVLAFGSAVYRGPRLGGPLDLRM